DESQGHFPPGVTGDRTRQELYISKSWTLPIGSWSARDAGLGGFSLDVHHAYDPGTGQLLLGNGTRRTAEASVASIRRIHEDVGKTPAVAPDGSIYTCRLYNEIAIYRTTPEGERTRIAGNGTNVHSGDGGPAIDAGLDSCNGLAIGPDGSLYVALRARVRRIDPAGIITTVVGSGQYVQYVWQRTPDGTAAAAAPLGDIHALAVSSDGTIYLSESHYNVEGTVRSVKSDGILRTKLGSFPRGPLVIRGSKLYFSGGTQPVMVYTLDTVTGDIEKVFGCSGGADCRSGSYVGQA